MVQGLLKGVAVGVAVSTALVVVASQVMGPVQISLSSGDRARTASIGTRAPLQATESISSPGTDAEGDTPQSGVSDQPSDEQAARVSPLDGSDGGVLASVDTATAPSEAKASPDGDAPKTALREDVEADRGESTGAESAPEPAENPPNSLAAQVENGDKSGDNATDAASSPMTVAGGDVAIKVAEIDQPSHPTDGRAPSRKAVADDTVSSTPSRIAAPASPGADLIPKANLTAPRTDVTLSPSIELPDGETRISAADTQSIDEPVFPVPDAQPPQPPARDERPVQDTAPTDLARSADPETSKAGGRDFAATEVTTADVAPGPQALQDTSRQDVPPGPPKSSDTAPISGNPTGRDSVRINRLTQIEPPAEPAGDAQAGDLGDPATSENATEDADQTIDGDGDDMDEDAAADAAFAESRLSQDGNGAGSTDGAVPTRQPSNLIERRLQAAEGTIGDENGDESPDMELDGDLAVEPGSVVLSQRELAAIGSAAVPDDTDGPDPKSEASNTQARMPDLTGVAIDDFDQPFDNPAGLPLVSIILLDYGGPSIDLPLPISVALDASQPNVAARAQQYRAQGYEILIIPSLPRGGAAQDVEQALQVNFQAVDTAVAIIPHPTSDLQKSRAAVETLVERMAETGHGLVSFPSGLNTAQHLAERQNVPAGIVFREVDAEGQDLRAVIRSIDQAAFRAKQEDAVILVGRNRPETRDALMEWRSGNRAESVTLAPVSAAIRALSR